MEITLRLTQDQAIILSSAMTLAKNNEMDQIFIRALDLYTNLLRATRKKEALCQLWYPSSGKIEDVSV